MTRPRRTAARIIRSDGWTLPRQRMFLKLLAVTGSVEIACAQANMSVSSAYRLRLHPDGAAFRDGWARALAACTTSLRQAAFDRALNGTTEPIIENGIVVGRRTVHNDRLLMFLLRHYDHAGGTGTQDRLIDSFDRLEAADIPDAEIVGDIAHAEIVGDTAAVSGNRLASE